MKELLVKKKSLTGLVHWLNENFVKQTGKKFSVGDVQSYIRRGHLPEYLGNNKIEREKSVADAKLYNVEKK